MTAPVVVCASTPSVQTVPDFLSATVSQVTSAKIAVLLTVQISVEDTENASPLQLALVMKAGLVLIVRARSVPMTAVATVYVLEECASAKLATLQNLALSLSARTLVAAMAFAMPLLAFAPVSPSTWASIALFPLALPFVPVMVLANTIPTSAIACRVGAELIAVLLFA
jgi:hypothetical protein